MRLSDLYGNDLTEREKLRSDVMFNLRCCIPCIVQSYDPRRGTVECQPAIREKIINQNEEIEYQNLPLLLDVPVVFPSTDSWSVSFPLKIGDECLVFFSDLSIDNFWEKGNVQNPIEDRRHDLSDGFAIPCNLSLTKGRKLADGLYLASSNASVLIGNSDVIFTCSSGSLNLSDLIKHTHTAPPMGGETTEMNF